MSGGRGNPGKAGPAKQKRRAPSAHRPAAIDFPVVGIGASAGGLAACTRLLDAWPDADAMAFILVQHLDPTHESMMAELLARHTALSVIQAADGMPVEPGHLYIIPPASFLAIGEGALHLQPTEGARGARLPFDFLLQSMARECGARAIGVVLSGTGADGSVGVRAIKQSGGFVVAQAPDEAEYDGMPRSAIATGAVDAVLPVVEMPAAIRQRQSRAGRRGTKPPPAPGSDELAEIVALLRRRTPHDFTLYKPGTLQRRVERRMAMAGTEDMATYLATLQNDPAEIERLAKDLLIHVTSFFRDPAVFDILAKTAVSELIGASQAPHTLRIWIAGCSTGEEAYSLSMLFQEQIAAANNNTKLQMFASDADAEAIAFAREGLYPATITDAVSGARLRRFFVEEQHGYRVLPTLRASIVFSVQDLLADPPFSRIDLVSCRNVLIYLGQEAQRRILSLFHFALRQGGFLLLGNAEGVGVASDRFAVMSKPARLYRHVGRSLPGDVDFARTANPSLRLPAAAAGIAPPSRQAALAELCRRHALETHAPATVLCNRKYECLYSLGPIGRYLRMAPGHATLDVLAMAREELRPRLRATILRAIEDNAPVIVDGGRVRHAGSSLAFTIAVHPVEHDGEALLLIYFVDAPEQPPPPAGATPDSPRLAARVVELERELATTQRDLQGAIHSLELARDEQKVITENALSANEEFQSTNEELLTSKEELQSLNEELTALNSQLQETLEQQRTTSNDLQNVLYSTDTATVFLDSELKIRFFTPATKALFSVIRTDIGRPLADLHSLAGDTMLVAEARAVLESFVPVAREVETPGGVWSRRIMPYRTHDGVVAGVVITFTDITQSKRAALALDASRREAETANMEKSRFLAAASHDLRQPLQTLALLQGLLAKRVEGTAAAPLVVRLEETVGAMSGMLDTLLDINQIEAGIVRAAIARFGLDDLLGRLSDAFADVAQAQGIGLRVVPSGLTVASDPRLLEQMLRNLLANAIKYTTNGRVLLGCRRRGGVVRIEVWDTGIGIADGALGTIFEEYRQLDNAARERNRGLGLGLSIVQRLGALLEHRIRVRSWPGRGSVFSVEVPVAAGAMPMVAEAAPQPAATGAPRRAGRLLVVEDDPEVRELLSLILSEGGYHADAVPDGPAALRLAASVRPDLLLTDYNLPNGMDGLAVAARLRDALGAAMPVIILTGDISAEARSAIAAGRCLHLDKPVKPAELVQAVQGLLPRAAGVVESPVAPSARHVVFIVDDDSTIRDLARTILEEDGRSVQDFASGEAFLAAYRAGSDGCLLIDARLPGIGGLDLLRRLRAAGDRLPAIMITGSSDVAMAVEAMKAGAADFIEKPIAAADLLASIGRALERAADSTTRSAWQADAEARIARLTPRQRDIMERVLAGHPSKNIAADLGLSQRTVENHRAAIMQKTETRSLPALARLALAAAAHSSLPKA